MIKYWTHICLILTALVTLLVGCDSVPTYDQRLVQVDSLLNDRTPDKRKVALEQIEAIAPDELTNSADKAYHALLLTQARNRARSPRNLRARTFLKEPPTRT